MRLPDGEIVPVGEFKSMSKLDRDTLIYYLGEEKRVIPASAKKKARVEWVTDYNPGNALLNQPLQPGPESPICKQCDLYNNGCRTPFMPYAGSTTPLVTVIFEGVNRAEDMEGELGHGGSSQRLRRIIKDAVAATGVTEADIRWVPMTRCHSWAKKVIDLKPRGNWCRYHVIDDLLRHPPAVIMPVGTKALGLLSHKSNAGEWSGRTLTFRGWPDDWLMDAKYALPRVLHQPNVPKGAPVPPPLPPDILGHPLFGPPSDVRVPVCPIQAPRLIDLAQSDKVTKEWESHIVRALKLAKDGVKALTYTRPWYRFTEDVEAIEQTLRELLTNPGLRLCYDTETTGLRPWAASAAIVSMMFRWTDPADGQPRSLGFPWDCENSAVRPHIKRLKLLVWAVLIQSSLVGHNLTFDMLYTFAVFWRKHLTGWTDPAFNRRRDKLVTELANACHCDTWHMAFAWQQRRGSLGLDALAYDWVPDLAGYEEEMTLLIGLHHEAMNPAAGKGGHYLNCPKEKWPTHLQPYVMGDVEVCYQAHDKIQAKLEGSTVYTFPLANPNAPGKFRYFTPQNRDFVYHQIMAPAAAVLMKMMARGMYIDQTALVNMEDQMPKDIRKLREDLKTVDPRIEAWVATQEATQKGKKIKGDYDDDGEERYAKWEFDLEDKAQLKDLLFNCLDLPVLRFTKGGRKLLGDDVQKAHDAMARAVRQEMTEIADNPVMVEKAVQAQLREVAAVDKFTLNKICCQFENLRPLQKYRKALKLYSTYVRPLRNLFSVGLDKKERTADAHLCFDQCIHARFMLTGTRGGRLCVSGETILDVRVNGVKKLVAIKDIWKYNKQHVTVKTHKGRWCRISKLYYKGTEQMYEAVSASGFTIKATAQHRIYTSSGWKHLGDITRQDTVLVDTDSRPEAGSNGGQFSSAGLGKEVELSDRKRAHLAAGRTPQLARVPSISGTAKATVFSSAGRSPNRKPERRTETIAVNTRGETYLADSAWNSGGADCEDVQNYPVFSATEYAGIWVTEIGQRPAESTGTDRGPDFGNQPDVPRIDGGLRELLRGQTCFLPGSLRRVYKPTDSGVVFEGHVSHAVYATQRDVWRLGGDIVVNEPARALHFKRADRSGHTALQGIRIQRELASRLRSDWYKHTGGDRRGVPYRIRRQAQYGCSDETGLPSASLHDEGSTVQRWNGGGINQGCFEHLLEIKSVGVEAVWDIEVEEDHSYLAHGLFHHNSCQDPNLQQLPRDGVVKSMFTSRFKERGCIYQADLSQIELRLLAAACGDSMMVKAYFDDIDLHSQTTSLIFGVKYEEFSKDNMKRLQKLGKDKEAKALDEKRSIGKCVDPLTLVSVNGSIARIGDVHSGRQDDTFYPVTGMSIQTPTGVAEIRSFYSNGVKERLLVCSLHGILSCSLNHRFQLADGSLVMASDLKEGMVLKDGQALVSGSSDSKVFFNPFGTEPKSDVFQVNVTRELAYVLGLFYGDGCSVRNRIEITTGGKPEAFAWQDTVAEALKTCGFEPCIQRTTFSGTHKSAKLGKITGASGSVRFGCKRVSDLFVQLGAVDATDYRRRTLLIPNWLFNASRDVKLEFLAGLLDTDGYVKKDGSAYVTSKSWRFAQDLQVLLGTLNIASTVSPSWNKLHSKHYFNVRIARRDSGEFVCRLRHTAKRERLNPKVAFRYGARVKNTVKLVLPLERAALVEISVDAPHLYLPEGLTTHQTVNFLTGYGGGAMGLQNVLAGKDIYKSPEECQLIIDKFFDAYPALRTLLQKYKRFILEEQVAVSIFGRVRVFEEVLGNDEEAKAKALRAGCNHLIQSTASDMMLVALFCIENLMRRAGLESLLVSTVHDSLLIDCIREELPQVHEIVMLVLNDFPGVFKAVFGDGYDTSWMTVGFTGDAEVGENYLAMRKIPKMDIDWTELLAL